MGKIAVFFANGCEEIEGLSVVDILRRAKMDVTSVSITQETKITGSHNIVFEADELFEKIDFSKYDAVVLPGGMPGTNHLMAHDGVRSQAKAFFEQGKLVAAICAAPTVLGDIGILNGKRATCHPGFEEKLTGATLSEDKVVRDGNIITSRGMGTSIDFGLEIVSYFGTKDLVLDVKKHLVYA